MKKINYELYRNNNSENNGYGKVYARVKLGQTVGLKELCVRLAQRNKLVTEATAMMVLTDVIDVITDLLAEGNRVKLDDLCILSLALESSGAESEAAFDARRHIKGVKLNVRSTGGLRRRMSEMFTK